MIWRWRFSWVWAAVILAGCAGDGPGVNSDGASLTPPTRALAPSTAGDLAVAARALAAGRPGLARSHLARVLLARPDDPRARLVAAEVLLAQGAARAAASAFDALAGAPEVAARADQGAGLALLALGDRPAALRRLRQAVAADATLWRAWNGLGYYHDTQGAWGLAADRYGRALALKPEAAVVHNNLGYSLLLQRRFAEARLAFRRALALDGTLAAARENLRLAYAWQGRYGDALAGAARPDEARALNNVGFVALMRGDLERASAFFLRAMERDPRYNEAASRNLAYLKGLRGADPAPAP